MKKQEIHFLLPNTDAQITEGRPVVRETTLTEFIATRMKINEEEEEELSRYGENFVTRCNFIYPLMTSQVLNGE